MGLDLGQKQDFSAVAVVERDEERLAFLPPTFRSMRVRHLERMPLGTPYVNVVARVSEILWHPELAWRSRLVVDATGVGAPVGAGVNGNMQKKDCPEFRPRMNANKREYKTVKDYDPVLRAHCRLDEEG